MMAAICLDTMVESDPEVIDCRLGDGAALLNLRSSVYFSLDKMGAAVWKELAQPTSLEHLCDSVRHAYDVEPDRCISELTAFVTRLEAAGLIRLCSVPGNA